MRAPLILAIVLIAPALALLAPPATAQVLMVPSTTEVRLQPLEGVLEHGGVYRTSGEVRYSYFALGSVALSSTRAVVRVVEQPEWAVVHVSPSVIHFPIYSSPSGQTVSAPPQKFTITVSLAPDAPAGAAATIRIVVHSEPNTPIGASSGEDSLLAKVSSVPCHDAEAAQADAVPLEERSADENVTAQSVGAAPVPVAPSGALVTLGLAGAGAGAVYGARRRRLTR